jgi:uncharacterized membrane-anchored protein YitT (DUF2179 family)
MALMVIVSKYEVGRIRHIVRQYDPRAFISVTEGVRIEGNYKRKLT